MYRPSNDSITNRSTDFPIVKVLILGDQAIGKTSLMLRFTDDNFNDNYFNTLGIDFKSKSIIYKGREYLLQIWDSAGQEQFKNITRTYYKKSSAIIVAFDSTRSDSFDNVRTWITNITVEIEDKIPIVIVATKCDIEGSNDNIKKGKFLAKELRLSYFKTSSKMNINIEKLFVHLVEVAFKSRTIDYGSNSFLKSQLNANRKKNCCH
ncbi:hypothetical protein SteCoe_28613 [Stentor coeruleus]|uniref:Uncharacterized protein n=1 Tax=Stentor coeruleus TaxID=5963 RepID=A0A1R2B7S4_9CILI|nr:hypothetical protein SteCoe_28613 [Stentor coeruleus]